MTKRDLRPLWAALVGIYGARFVRDFGSDPSTTAAGALWERGLAGMGDDAIRRGIDACVASGDDWPPSLPAFRAMCLDIPPLAAVKEALRTGRPPEALRRFLVLVHARLDAFELRRASAEKGERMIADAYGLARDAVLRGEPLPDMPAGHIEAPREPERKPADPERARAAMAAAAAVLGAAHADATEGAT
jgi:hypothetical protein